MGWLTSHLEGEAGLFLLLTNLIDMSTVSVVMPVPNHLQHGSPVQVGTPEVPTCTPTEDRPTLRGPTLTEEIP